MVRFDPVVTVAPCSLPATTMQVTFFLQFADGRRVAAQPIVREDSRPVVAVVWSVSRTAWRPHDRGSPTGRNPPFGRYHRPSGTGTSTGRQSAQTFVVLGNSDLVDKLGVVVSRRRE